MSVEQQVKLRGNKSRLKHAWALGDFPNDVIKKIGEQFIYKMATGHTDITGHDFSSMFTDAINGVQKESPLGIADVVLDGNAWSLKTIKAKKPFNQQTVRLISGRNSPDYSLGIKNVHTDLQATGKAVLSIWNARVNESLDAHHELRLVVLMRNFESREFVLFEEIVHRYAINNYRWEKNPAGNFLGYDITTNTHCFTWQPHGAQFTILKRVPACATKFMINQPIPTIAPEHILNAVQYHQGMIEIVSG